MVVIVNAAGWLTVKVVESAEVSVGAEVTDSTNAWVLLPIALLAVIVTAYVPPLPVLGVPASVAVPLPLSRNVTPAGSVPDSESAGAGEPEVVTVNEPAAPTEKTLTWRW